MPSRFYCRSNAYIALEWLAIGWLVSGEYSWLMSHARLCSRMNGCGCLPTPWRQRCRGLVGFDLSTVEKPGLNRKTGQNCSFFQPLPSRAGSTRVSGWLSVLRIICVQFGHTWNKFTFRSLNLSPLIFILEQKNHIQPTYKASANEIPQQ